MKVATAAILLFVFCNTLYSQFTYTRDVRDSANTIYPYDMIVTNADNCIVATAPLDFTHSHGIYITKLNNRGNLVWSKNYTFFNAFFSTTEKLYNADNDEFFCAVRTDGIAFGGDLLFKADSNGNILWAKRIRPTIGGYLTSPYGLVYTNDKSIYVINDISALGLSILKLNSIGEPLWNKFLQIDSGNVFSLLAYVTASTDNGLILSTTSSKNLQDKYYNHIFKISKDGNAEYEYTTNQASDDYIYGWAAKTGNDGKLNILFSQYSHYRYSILNLSTGQAETYNTGQSIFDIQSFLRSNNVNIFKGVVFPYVGFQDFLLQGAFTKKWDLIQTTPYHFSRLKTAARIQRYDSLGRICPNYQIQDSQRVNEKVSFKFTKSSFHFSASPVEFNVTDTVLSMQNIDTITKVCAGVPPPVKHSYTTNESITNNVASIKIFPNPASTQLNIFINSISAYTSKIEISDLHGTILKTQSQQISTGKNNIEINISGLTQGIYFLKLSTPLETIYQKIIKQ